MTPPLRLSSLLHALVVLALLTLPHHVDQGNAEAESAGANAKREEPLDVTIIAPPSKEEDVVVEDEGLKALKKLAPHAGDECENFYGGIGIIDGAYGVAEVHVGYPAHKAGIEVGDIVTSDGPIRGEIGTPVRVTVLRGMRTLVFDLVRDKICVA